MDSDYYAFSTKNVQGKKLNERKKRGKGKCKIFKLKCKYLFSLFPLATFSLSFLESWRWNEWIKYLWRKMGIIIYIFLRLEVGAVPIYFFLLLLLGAHYYRVVDSARKEEENIYIYFNGLGKHFYIWDDEDLVADGAHSWFLNNTHVLQSSKWIKRTEWFCWCTGKKEDQGLLSHLPWKW